MNRIGNPLNEIYFYRRGSSLRAGDCFGDKMEISFQPILCLIFFLVVNIPNFSNTLKTHERTLMSSYFVTAFISSLLNIWILHPKYFQWFEPDLFVIFNGKPMAKKWRFSDTKTNEGRFYKSRWIQKSFLNHSIETSTRRGIFLKTFLVRKKNGDSLTESQCPKDSQPQHLQVKKKK